MQKRLWGVSAAALALTGLTVTGCGTAPGDTSSSWAKVSLKYITSCTSEKKTRPHSIQKNVGSLQLNSRVVAKDFPTRGKALHYMSSIFEKTYLGNIMDNIFFREKFPEFNLGYGIRAQSGGGLGHSGYMWKYQTWGFEINALKGDTGNLTLAKKLVKYCEQHYTHRKETTGLFLVNDHDNPHSKYVYQDIIVWVMNPGFRRFLLDGVSLGFQ
jgi:hypothetical protein